MNIQTQWRIRAHSLDTVRSHFNSQQAHFEVTHPPHSEVTRWPHAVSLLWALPEFTTHTVGLLWAIREIARWAHHVVVTVSSQFCSHPNRSALKVKIEVHKCSDLHFRNMETWSGIFNAPFWPRKEFLKSGLYINNFFYYQNALNQTNEKRD